MKRSWVARVAALAVVGLAGNALQAAGVPLTVQATSLLAIQPYNLGEGAKDDAYLLVSGEVAGKPIDARVPQQATLQAGPKLQAIADKKPLDLWKGELNDGEFAVVTVTLMQGKGTDTAKTKQFLDELNSADQKVAGWGKKTLTQADFTKLAEDTLKADQGVVKNVKKIFSRDANTDHFGGQFTLVLWNNGGKIVKRLDPVGLTFGEHYGNDIKIYSKLKNTRNNVLVKNEQGQWEEQQLEPLNDDQTAVRVKELETEYVKQANGANPVRHVTDYVVEVAVTGTDNKPLGWELGGVVTGIDNIHTYWNFAQ